MQRHVAARSHLAMTMGSPGYLHVNNNNMPLKQKPAVVVARFDSSTKARIYRVDHECALSVAIYPLHPQVLLNTCKYAMERNLHKTEKHRYYYMESYTLNVDRSALDPAVEGCETYLPAPRWAN
ncbi:hypothetical protein CBL_05326 [Carabus blaptoides fortunei]